MTNQIATVETIRGVLVTVDRQVGTVELPAEDVLRGMYRAIGCRTVERVPLASVPTLDMWVDEDGLCTATPRLNQVATFIAHAFQIHPTHGDPDLDRFALQPYAGNALFLSANDEGDCVDVPSELDRLWEAAKALGDGGVATLLAEAARL